MASIWQEVLPNGLIGADSNFFDVGGQSLTATRVVTRIRRRFGIELPLRELFRAPILRDFSAEVERRVNDRIGAMSAEEVSRLLQQERR